eukprot:COSAG01_NODE_2345_length_7860_cov_23.900528_9_plen_112_part_00
MVLDSGSFPRGGVQKYLYADLPIMQGWWGGRLWLAGFPLCFREKYGKLARTDLKNERISRSGGFQACYEIIRGVVGWSESRPESQYGPVLLNPTPWERARILWPAVVLASC